ncbi:MAG TPA: TetR/AcrR family transcriptional regulator, partial [Mycobacterium sp.]
RDDLHARTRAGIAAVLGFSSADPGRGRILFTDARANPVLARRRAASQDQLLHLMVEDGWQIPDAQPVAAMVGAAMYAGALGELAQQWLAGRLGSDLDAVVDSAIALVRGRL